MSDKQREAAGQWLAKAESDWRTVTLLSGHEDCPRDSVCFHCQQYVEKLLKSVLTLHATEAPKTHDLKRLVELALPMVPALLGLLETADMLTDYAVQSRYPDEWREIGLEEMNEVQNLTRQFADVLLPVLMNQDTS